MTEEPKTVAGPVTVDQMVRDPEWIRRRLQEMARQQFVLQELWPDVPSASPSRRRKLADWWSGWLCHWRERAALRLAPWLDNYGEGL